MKQLATLALLFTLAIQLTAQTRTGDEKLIDSLFYDRGELFFTFQIADRSEIATLTRIISIDNLQGTLVTAYANREEFRKFLRLGYHYEIHQSPGTLIPEQELLSQCRDPKSPMTTWNYYPNYQQYLDFMAGFVTTYPEICKLDTVGTSIQGRLILALRISDNVNQPEEPEPHFLYTSSIHGDELTGYILMMHLIDTLLQGYGSDQRITDLINNVEIVINPLSNPDGTFHGGNNSVYGAVRYNANNIDLNRNFPDPKVGPHPDGNAWQQETVAWMAYADSNRFSMAMNFHGGAEVFNYPWDTWAKLSADDAWWQYVAREYVDTVHLHAPGYYLTDLQNGITNGYAWYEINGGRQDYMNYFHNCRETTLEVSEVKLIAASQLLNHWNYNYRSLLNYIEQVQYGFSGIVTDTLTGEPLKAKVNIFGHDFDNSFVYSSLPTGFYTRPIAEGTYNVAFSSPGYFSKSIKDVQVTKLNKTILDVQLKPVTFGVDEPSVRAALIFPNPGNGNFRITLPEKSTDQIDVEIYTTLGKSIFSGQLHSLNGIVHNAPVLEHPGIYYIRVTQGKTTYSDKIVVVR